MNKEYLRISELNQLIGGAIHASFPQPLWICGEVQGYNRNRSKNHIFFELIEKDPDSKNIIAKIGLVLFAGRKAHIQSILKQSENAFALKDDIEVKLACSIDFYPPHGVVRLIVESIDPTYTLGKFAQEKQKLIALLKKKGTLDKNKQLGLTSVPLCLGLVTADDSAAYNDFRSELARSGFAFEVYLRNALMQGKSSEKDICKAIDELGKIKNLDAIVITRGGGSIADLSWFDSQAIAEKIAACPVPVLSGIGHEINITITDMAAHTYAKTPTAIAQFLVNRVQIFLDEIDEKLEEITSGAQEIIEEEKQRLKDSAVSLQNSTRSYLKDHNEKIIRFQEILRQKPGSLLKNKAKMVADRRAVLKKITASYFSSKRVTLNGYKRMIDNFDPVNTLKRGFSITRTQDGKVLKDIGFIHPGEKLTTEVAGGVITSEIKKIRKT